MWEVIVGVVLTAALGGVLVPWVTGLAVRRREQASTSVDLLERLAESLWTYWKGALRIAYYGKQGPSGAANFDAAIESWNSDASWLIGNQIQIQVSRAKRLLNEHTHAIIDETQRQAVKELDQQIEDKIANASASEWSDYYEDLYTTKRHVIDKLLADVTRDLKLTPWYRRVLRRV